MNPTGLLISTLTLATLLGTAQATAAPAKDDSDAPHSAPSDYFQPQSETTTGTLTIGGNRIAYDAVAGTLVVHPKGWDDAARPTDKASGSDQGPSNPTAEASMFYVAYFEHGIDPSRRPITFLFNGGPGSSTVWLHMGAFGPRRVVTSDHSHTPAAPYRLVNNAYSLLDASDLVFIDAPGTGFSRIAGKNKKKDFYGVDADAHAFAEFITEFLSKYGRWNSPKYLFGESYGTPRAAVLVNMLETGYSTDFNGVILLSQILNFDLSVDGPVNNPGIDLPYELALPTYAATAWYHHKLPGETRPHLTPLLKEVEHFALGPYAHALAEGAGLSAARRAAIANKLHQYTGLPVSYLLKANLRIDGGEFEKSLQGNEDLTTGRLDTRFSGPTLDPLSERSEYDPQSAAISSAYVSEFNNYVRKTLHYGQGKKYKPEISVWRSWNFQHQPPGARRPLSRATNVMPDLANAMKQDPDLKILLTGGYFDLATPFCEGKYEMSHLPIPAKLQRNIQYHYYRSGHMVYAHEPSLKALHHDVAAFIRETDNLSH